MVESEVVAPGSVDAVLSGKHYNRAIRCHKIVFEAMQRLRFLAFYESLPCDEAEQLCHFTENLGPYTDEFTDFTNFEYWRAAYDSFVMAQSKENSTFAYWSTYLEMIQLLLLFIRATRTSNWELHLSALRSMIPWFFATDRINYARYAPCYWLEMISLGSTHPCKLL